MTTLTLHYVYDPLCGWCYAVTPMIEAVAQTGIEIVLHGGGLWEPATSPMPEKRAYIRQNDTRIAALTGMAFGPAYLDGLLTDATTVFWSSPTIAAVLAAGTMETGADLRMMHAIQTAGAWSRRRFSRKWPRRSVWRRTLSSMPSRARRRTSISRELAAGCSSLGWPASPASFLNMTVSWSESSMSPFTADRTPSCTPSMPSRRFRPLPELSPPVTRQFHFLRKDNS